MVIKKKSFVFKTLNPIKNVHENDKFVREIARVLDMNIISGPHSLYIDDKGNEGVSSVTIIKTSHICIHSWDQKSPGVIHLDIFSCKLFSVKKVKNFLLKRFNIKGKIHVK
jgi:S-adenosylmethionine/arginine decarboxylase-like enzyme